MSVERVRRRKGEKKHLHIHREKVLGEECHE